MRQSFFPFSLFSSSLCEFRLPAAGYSKLTLFPFPLRPIESGAPRRPHGSNVKLVGLARVVTDYVTFAYLTDVFILEEFQRRGLASWMMQGLKELVEEWPNLRGLVLMTHDKSAAKMYQRELGALDWDQGPSAGLVLLEMPGGGVKDIPEDHK